MASVPPSDRSDVVDRYINVRKFVVEPRATFYLRVSATEEINDLRFSKYR